MRLSANPKKREGSWTVRGENSSHVKQQNWARVFDMEILQI